VLEHFEVDEIVGRYTALYQRSSEAAAMGGRA
jgi:hypothetical protein